MKPFHAVLLLALGLGSVLSGCRQQEGSAEPPAAAEPALTVESTSVVPQQVLVAYVTGVVVPERVNATLGGVAVTALRMDDGALALVVPGSVLGPQQLQLTIDSHALSASVEVRAAPSVADPDQYLADAEAAADTELEALETKYADASQRPPSLDLAQFQRDLAKMRAQRDDGRAKLAAATPEQRAQVAAFFAANEEVLGLGATQLHAVRAASADGACLSETGTLLETHEECAKAFEAFTRQRVKRLLVMAAITAVAYAESMTGLGLVAGATTAYLLYKELAGIQDGVLQRFLDPVLAKLKHPSTYAEGPSAQSVRAHAGSDGAAYSMRKPNAFAAMAVYRSLSSTDEGTLLDSVRTFERSVNRVRGLFLLDAVTPLVPAKPARYVFEPIPARYLQLGSISPSDIRGSATVSGSEWMLNFEKAGLSGTLPFTFEVRYLPPNQPAQSMTVNGSLVALNFVEGTLSAGGAHACGLTALGDVYCWGSNSSGQLGNGSTTDSPVPVLVAAGGRSFKQVTAGGRHTCALSESGQAWCWGHNAYGDLGDGSRTDSLTPVAVSGGLVFQQLSAGNADHTCGVTVDQVGYCWGSNGAFAVGDGGVPCDLCLGTLPSRTVPTPVAGEHRFKAISAGFGHTCALDTAGKAWCWGWNEHGQVGSGDVCGMCKSSTPLAVTGDYTFASISAGGFLTMALTAAGEPYRWGGNSVEPYALFPGARFLQVSAGLSSACGLWASGSASCWGDNASGQLGDGTTTSHSFGPVAGGHAFRSISVRGDFVVALDAAGVTYGWGKNTYGQLGDPATAIYLEPVTVVGSVRFQ